MLRGFLPEKLCPRRAPLDQSLSVHPSSQPPSLTSPRPPVPGGCARPGLCASCPSLPGWVRGGNSWTEGGGEGWGWPPGEKQEGARPGSGASGVMAIFASAESSHSAATVRPGLDQLFLRDPCPPQRGLPVCGHPLCPPAGGLHPVRGPGWAGAGGN